ncbi:MAG TPA: hypothetical protein VJT84_12970 [Gaiellaceae bacterium]|nr:hypothetical protein [Gaiellaceae bacterium]
MIARFLHLLFVVAFVVTLTGAAAAGPRQPVAAPGATSALLISSEEAVALALNDVSPAKGGFVLRHPRHRATLTTDGFAFRPLRGPGWRWQLAAASAGVEVGPVRPVRRGGAIVYPRGGLNERYLPRSGSVEQQFVLPGRLDLGGRDLVITGRVESSGSFRRTGDGWLWETKQGVVRLGDVTVFDAGGRRLPARMEVGRSWTRIVVPGPALARAAYPVTVDPEVGANDFRISDMGPGRNAFDAFDPAVAYNPASNEYLVVWTGDATAQPFGDENEFDIFGQRVDAATGAEVGANDFRISDMGPAANTSFDAQQPAVAYNPASNQYLIVWQGDDDTAPLVNNETEIFGQRLTATGAATGANDFRISDMGPDGNTSFGAAGPTVAYNSTTNEYLVVWQGDDDTAPLVNGENEIFGQRLTATGAATGANDFRISDMGPDGNTSFAARSPAVAYNATSNEYLVVWEGDDDTAPLVEGELEIFGQRLTATGAATGANDFRISDMGPDGSIDFFVRSPTVAYNATSNEYLVVWHGDDDIAPLVDNEREVFGQRLTATGAATGANDFRVSDMGPDGNPSFGTAFPAVAYSSANDEYLVVWYGNDDTPPLVANENEVFGQRLNGTTGVEAGENDVRVSQQGEPDPAAASDAAVAYNATNNEYLVVWHGDDTPPLANGETEIFGQRVDAATGAEVGANDFRISDMGPDGTFAFEARDPAVAYNATNNEYLVVWWGDDDTAPLVNGEREIFGQRLDAATGAEVGVNDFRISDMGTDGETSFAAFDPAVAHNQTNNQYVVVWRGDDGTAPLVDEEFEIFGQRLDAATGAEVGTNDFRISDMGPDGSTGFFASDPAVAYNSRSNQYLVVWHGDDQLKTLVDQEFEIFGQRLNAATGAQVGGNDFRISDMGPNGSVNFFALWPDVAYNSRSNQYLVVWAGDDNRAPLVDNEVEIFGQRLTTTGGATGGNDFRISDLGPNKNLSFAALNPAVAYNVTGNEYLVVWEGDDDTPPLVDGENEIFGQRLTATGGATGANDFRLSDLGPDGDVNFAASHPAVAHGAAGNEYLVVWHGDEDAPPLADNEFEIFGQRFTPAGS